MHDFVVMNVANDQNWARHVKQNSGKYRNDLAGLLATAAHSSIKF